MLKKKLIFHYSVTTDFELKKHFLINSLYDNIDIARNGNYSLCRLYQKCMEN